MGQFPLEQGSLEVAPRLTFSCSRQRPWNWTKSLKDHLTIHFVVAGAGGAEENGEPPNNNVVDSPYHRKHETVLGS